VMGGVARGFKAAYNCAPEHADGQVTWAEWLQAKYGRAA
jgi:hypothetical protein